MNDMTFGRLRFGTLSTPGACSNGGDLVTMRSRTLPRLATVLLTRLGGSDPALIGDLSEAYAAGRSSVWLWRQVSLAIAIEAWRDIRHRKLRAAGAIAVALSVYFALALSGAAIANDVNRVVTPHVPGWMLHYFVYQIFESIIWVWVASWTIGVLIMALNRSHGRVSLVALIVFLVLIEFPQWTLLPWLSPAGLSGEIVIFQTTVVMLKIAGLVAGFATFQAPRNGVTRTC